MKKIIFSLLISGLALTACEDDNSKASDATDNNATDEVIDETEDLGEFKMASLDTFGVELSMNLPQYERAMNQMFKPKIEEMDEGMKWKVTIGREDKEKFCLIVEDAFGDYKLAEDEGVEIDLIKDKKLQIEEYGFKTANYLIDEEDLIMYEVTFDEESGIEPHFHVMGIVKNGENIFKVYSDDAITNFNEMKAKKMVETIRSMHEDKDADAPAA